MVNVFQNLRWQINGPLIAIVLTAAAVLVGCKPASELKPIAPEQVILCFGDSLTHGTGTDAANSYPSILAERSGRVVINSGKPGETSREGLKRLPTVLEANPPSLVVLCHGGNDILQRLDYAETKKNIRTMIEVCQERNIQVLLIAVPSVLSDAHPLYAQVANEKGVPIETKALGRLIKNDAYRSDQVHLNKAGYRKLAEAVHSLLKSTGAL